MTYKGNRTEWSGGFNKAMNEYILQTESYGIFKSHGRKNMHKLQGKEKLSSFYPG